MLKKYLDFLLHHFLTATIFLLFISSTLTRCTSTQTLNLVVEHDRVKSITRVKHNFYYKGSEEIQTPLQTVQQTISKETSPVTGITYKVFDKLTLGANAYEIEDTVYILLLDEIYPIPIEKLETQNTTKLAQERSTIRTLDSSYVSVVTGYQQYQRKHFNIVYTLPTQLVEEIPCADQIKFRYYSGHHMMTINLNPPHLDYLKTLLNTPGNVIIPKE